eukprot:s1859_g5.t1
MLAPLCSSYKSCSECITQHSCGWAHKNGCVRSSRAYSTNFLPYVWGDAEKCPETCGGHKDSTSCTKHAGCGWCSFSGACFPGDSSGPDYAATGKRCTPWCYGKQPCSKASFGGFLGFLASLMKILFVLALVALGRLEQHWGDRARTAVETAEVREGEVDLRGAASPGCMVLKNPQISSFEEHI